MPLADDERRMHVALRLARYAAATQEIPVGALVVIDGDIVGKGWNRPHSHGLPTRRTPPRPSIGRPRLTDSRLPDVCAENAKV